jgi:hypothetical protein
MVQRRKKRRRLKRRRQPGLAAPLEVMNATFRQRRTIMTFMGSDRDKRKRIARRSI